MSTQTPVQVVASLLGERTSASAVHKCDLKQTDGDVTMPAQLLAAPHSCICLLAAYTLVLLSMAVSKPRSKLTQW